MYCPMCGDTLKEQGGVLVCEGGRMQLSQHMAERLQSCFVAKTEEPEEFVFPSGSGYRFGGRWFCPGCGILMHEGQPGAVRCPQCGRNIGKFLHELGELHPHPGQ